VREEDYQHYDVAEEVDAAAYRRMQRKRRDKKEGDKDKDKDRDRAEIMTPAESIAGSDAEPHATPAAAASAVTVTLSGKKPLHTSHSVSQLQPMAAQRAGAQYSREAGVSPKVHALVPPQALSMQLANLPPLGDARPPSRTGSYIGAPARNGSYISSARGESYVGAPAAAANGQEHGSDRDMKPLKLERSHSVTLAEVYKQTRQPGDDIDTEDVRLDLNMRTNSIPLAYTSSSPPAPSPRSSDDGNEVAPALIAGKPTSVRFKLSDTAAAADALSETDSDPAARPERIAAIAAAMETSDAASRPVSPDHPMHSSENAKKPPAKAQDDEFLAPPPHPGTLSLHIHADNARDHAVAKSTNNAAVTFLASPAPSNTTSVTPMQTPVTVPVVATPSFRAPERPRCKTHRADCRHSPLFADAGVESRLGVLREWARERVRVRHLYSILLRLMSGYEHACRHRVVARASGDHAMMYPTLFLLTEHAFMESTMRLSNVLMQLTLTIRALHLATSVWRK